MRSICVLNASFLSLAFVFSCLNSGHWALADEATISPNAQSPNEVSQTREVHFNRDIRPILSAKCLSCHGPDSEHREADLRLDVESDAKASAIIEGDSESSELVSRIVSDDQDLKMPPTGSGKSLSDEEIELLKLWVDQDAPYQGHWAFESPRQAKLPSVDDSAWPKTPIDHFVLNQLERRDLKPSPDADKATLIRRLSLDLTGLPPTVQQVDEFLNDSSQNAYEKVVDRLLGSTAYGEHMARHWLDAARYADTNGYQYDLEREQWVWRDWLIHAYNTNMPFDQFTIEQLAGDLLPDATDNQKLATGFNRNHPITIEGGVIDEEYRMEYVVDRVVTTSTVWLGLTMTCARCHDHKYDPITQTEFYEFYSFFNNIPEKGFKGFEPTIQVPSPLRVDLIETAKNKVEVAEADLGKWIGKHHEQLDAWTQTVIEEAAKQRTVIVPTKRVSEGGAELSVQPDKSLLASGTKPGKDVYELEFPVKEPIRSIQLEALKDDSHVGGGTGRSFNANFVLSEFQVAVNSKKKPEEWTDVKIASATADYEQKGFPVANALNGKIGAEGWAVDGNTKYEDRTADFTLAEQIDPSQAASVRVRMHFAYGSNHQIGRFRLSSYDHDELPAEVVAAANSVTEMSERQPLGFSAEHLKLYEYLATRFDSDELKGLLQRTQSARQGLAEAESSPKTMVMSEMKTPRKAHVLLRGEYDNPQAEVHPGTPSALPPIPEGLPQNRLGLARWLTMPDHPLTARVTVNRYWQQLFGNGLVKTVEDFGSQGDWPSHIELLDWLAVEFVRGGWNTKDLLKQLVMSRTYQQASHVTEQLHQLDPENRLLARGPSMRLDAESIRDSLLMASGLLSEEVGGPSVFPYHPAGLWQEINNRPGYSRTYKQDTGDSLYRRSLYTFWKRTVAPPSMSAFDAPDREFCIVRRSRTNTPLQAFVMLHDPQMIESARHLAIRMLEDSSKSERERLAFGFRLCLTRSPTDAELVILDNILSRRRQQYQADPSVALQVISVGDSQADKSIDVIELAAWTIVARTLLNTSEFITKP